MINRLENVLATSGMTASISVLLIPGSILFMSLVALFFISWGYMLYRQEKISTFEFIIPIFIGVLVMMIIYSYRGYDAIIS